jgi:hypothetical protein
MTDGTDNGLGKLTLPQYTQPFTPGHKDYIGLNFSLHRFGSRKQGRFNVLHSFRFMAGMD